MRWSSKQPQQNPKWQHRNKLQLSPVPLPPHVVGHATTSQLWSLHPGTGTNGSMDFQRLSAWWLNQPIWKIWSSKWEPSQNRGENNKYLKPPPSFLSFCKNAYSLARWFKQAVPFERDGLKIKSDPFTQRLLDVGDWPYRIRGSRLVTAAGHHLVDSFLYKLNFHSDCLEYLGFARLMLGKSKKKNNGGGAKWWVAMVQSVI